MQRTVHTSEGASQKASSRAGKSSKMNGLRSRLLSGPLLPHRAPCHRAVIVASAAARRYPVNRVPENSEPAASYARSPATKGPSNPAGASALTTIMAEGGKSSSLRKLVVDGVDDSASVQVKFCLKYRTSYGQSVKIIGSHAKLGCWDINRALVLSWTEGDRWVATVELPAGAVYEYKYVLVDHDGRSALAWQGGSNSVLALGDADEREGVEVQDNWHNNPGQAAVIANGLATTREDKLQAWAAEMRQYRSIARTAQYELSRKAEELQASKAQIARLKMELSVSLKAREDLESRLADVENENLALRAQVAQSQIAMKSTLEEAIKLLQQEIEEGEEELYGVEDQEMPLSVTNGNGNGSGSGINGSSSSAAAAGGSGGWGGWVRSSSSSNGSATSSKESEAVYAGSSNGNGATFERFGFRLSGNAFDTTTPSEPPSASTSSSGPFSGSSSSSGGSHVLADWRTRLSGGSS